MRKPGPAGPPRGQDGQRHQHRQQEPPQVQFGIPDADGARAAQRRPVQRAELVGQREVQAEPALLGAGRVQPAGDAAEARVRLDDPFGAARHQAAHDRHGPRPAPHHDRRDQERCRQVHGVPRPHQGHERHARAQPDPRTQPGQRPAAAPQEAAHGGQAAERGPHVRHGLRAVVLRHPQAAEQDPGQPQHPRRAQPPPRPQRDRQAQAAGHRQVHPQRRHRAGQHGHRRDEQRDAASARRVEPGGRRVPAHLADVDGLVPAQPHPRRDEQQFRDGEGHPHRHQPPATIRPGPPG